MTVTMKANRIHVFGGPEAAAIDWFNAWYFGNVRIIVCPWAATLRHEGPLFTRENATRRESVEPSWNVVAC
jgi:hypothetical protein